MIRPLVMLCGFLLALPLSHAEVKTKMDEMLGYIFELKPYISSEAEYTDPKNAVVIQEVLKKMTALSKEIQHEDKIKKTPKAVSAMALHTQFKDAADIFERGNKTYSLWVLRSNLSNCVACHTQLPAHSTQFTTGRKKDFLTNSFREAEFLFIVRNFDKALELYDRTIAEYPQNKVSPQILETTLSRKVYYYTRVKRDLKGLSTSLLKDIKNKDIPAGISRRMKAYADAAQKLNALKAPSLTSAQELQTYAESVLAKDLEGHVEYEDPFLNLRRLQLSGYLYEYLDKNPESPLRPRIYYWLSFCESRWEKGPQDSLPESYLKKCVNEFPKSDIAPKCFAEYEDLMTFGYTGSSGTHLPPEVKKELQDMKQKMEAK